MNGWEPIDLAPIWDGIEDGTIEKPVPVIGHRQGGGALFYPNRINGVFGRYGSAKSYVAAIAALQEIGLGMTVWWFDLEDNPAGMVQRLMELGATRDDVVKHLRYYNPHGALQPKPLAALIEQHTEEAPTLTVADSAGEWLSLQGFKANSDDEVASFGKQYLHPFARSGSAVVSIDHIGHDQKDPLRTAGSYRKMAYISGGAYLVEMVREMGRGRSGMSKITCAKDRGGHYPRGAVVAELTIDATTTPYTWHLAPSVSTDEGPLANEPPYVHRTLAALEHTSPPALVRVLGDYLANDGHGKPLKHVTIQKALRRLEELGLATEIGGTAATGLEWCLSAYTDPDALLADLTPDLPEPL